MSKSIVAIVKYEKLLEPVQKAVELSHGLDLARRAENRGNLGRAIP